MTAPRDEVLRGMETLIGAMTETGLDAAGRRRLAQLVKDDPAARRLYLDHCQMHALLQSAHGVLQALAEPAGGRRRRAVWISAAAAAVLLLAAGAALTLRRGGERPLDASVASAQGKAWVLRGGDRTPAQDVRDLQDGDGVRTGPDGRADVRFGSGASVRLLADTEARFARTGGAPRTDLKAGALRCDVPPQSAGAPFVVATPHAEAAVLGTAFELLATRDETRLRTIRGRVRFTAGGRSVEVADGGLSSADAQGLLAWEPVCDLDFTVMKALPPRLETVYCDSDSLHTPDRRIRNAPKNVILAGGGLQFVAAEGMAPGQGLVVSRWTEEIGEDVIVEASVSGGDPWTLGLAVSGDSFQGYRVIFAVPKYPGGIGVDSIHPVDATLLAMDPRPIPYDRDHILRVEKRGPRIRVWLDRELRIDTEVTYPLAKDRRKTFAISNFGGSPIVRSLRVWKDAAR
jgi:ferric-dicitrate binding protein FerR (iron transport regulator)